MTATVCASVRFTHRAGRADSPAVRTGIPVRAWVVSALLAAALGLALAGPAWAAPQSAPPSPAAASPPNTPQGVTPPVGYVIGPDDRLAVVYWREENLSVDELVVRPDGMITLPLINDIKAGGLTPEQLRQSIQEAASRYVESPNVTVVVKQINSMKFFVTGMVNKPGPYPLTGPTTVLQAIAMAGGLQDFAKENDIVVMRTDGGRTQTFKFRYKDVIKGKNLDQNIQVKPGDTIVVP